MEIIRGDKERVGTYRVKEVPVSVNDGKVLHSVFFPQVKSTSLELRGWWWWKKYVRTEKWNFVYKENARERYVSEYTCVEEGGTESEHVQKYYHCLMGHTLDEANKIIDDYDAYQIRRDKEWEEEKLKEIEMESRKSSPLKIHRIN